LKMGRLPGFSGTRVPGFHSLLARWLSFCIDRLTEVGTVETASQLLMTATNLQALLYVYARSAYAE